MWRCRRFADVRRMHQAGGLVKDIFDELESELLQDILRSMIVWVMPGVDFRQLQFFPGIFERAEGSFGSEPFAPTAPHEMETHLEIRLAGRIEPRPKPAAADKIAIAVIEQRPILNTTGSLSPAVRDGRPALLRRPRRDCDPTGRRVPLCGNLWPVAQLRRRLTAAIPFARARCLGAQGFALGGRRGGCA